MCPVLLEKLNDYLSGNIFMNDKIELDSYFHFLTRDWIPIPVSIVSFLTDSKVTAMRAFDIVSLNSFDK